MSYAESQKNARGASETATKLAGVEAILACLRGEIDQNESVSASRIRHLEEENVKMKAKLGTDMGRINSLVDQLALIPVFEKRMSEIEAENQALKQWQSLRGNDAHFGNDAYSGVYVNTLKIPEIASALEKRVGEHTSFVQGLNGGVISI